MADEPTTDGEQTGDWRGAVVEGERGLEQEYPEPKDYVLNMFVHFAELGVKTGITFYTQGLIITGTLVSREQFHTANRDAMMGAGGDSFASVFETLAQSIRDEPVTSDGPTPTYGFAHLGAGQVMVGGEQEGIPGTGTSMRIALNDVNGWSLGTMSRSQKSRGR